MDWYTSLAARILGPNERDTSDHDVQTHCWSTLPIDLLPLIASFAAYAAETPDDYTRLALVSRTWAAIVRRRRWRVLDIGDSPSFAPTDKVAVLLRDPALAVNVRFLSLARATQRGASELQAEVASFVLPLCVNLRRLEAVLQLKTGPLILHTLQNPLSPATRITSLTLEFTAQTSQLDPAEMIRALANLANLKRLLLTLRPRAFEGAMCQPPPYNPPPSARLSLDYLDLVFPPTPNSSAGDPPNSSHLSFLHYLLAHLDTSTIRTLVIACPTSSTPGSAFHDILLPSLPSLRLFRLTSADNALDVFLPRLPSLISHLHYLQTLNLTNVDPIEITLSPSTSFSFPALLRSLPSSTEHVWVQALFDERIDDQGLQDALQDVLHDPTRKLRQVDCFFRKYPYERHLDLSVLDDSDEEDDDEEETMASTLIRGTVEGRSAWYRLLPPDPRPQVLCIQEPESYRNFGLSFPPRP